MSCRFLEVIGFLYITVLTIKFIQKLRACYNQFTPEKLRSMGKWAVITGATDGIGKSYAENIAEKGINVVLISRSIDKLHAVAKEIEDKYHVETKIIEADFKEPKKIYENIAKELENVEVGILINNVGMLPPIEYFHLQNADGLIDDVINVNVLSVVKMCQIVLPNMLKRRKGILINISSTAVLIPATPFMTVYAATKAFVRKFTRDLATEHHNSGVYIQCVLPAIVVTNMSKPVKPSWGIPVAKVFVESAMKTIGGDLETTGYWRHTLQVWILNAIETVVPGYGKKLVFDFLLKERNRLLRYKLKKGIAK